MIGPDMEWQRATALRYIEREIALQGSLANVYRIQVAAAAYVGADVSNVRAWWSRARR